MRDNSSMTKLIRVSRRRLLQLGAAGVGALAGLAPRGAGAVHVDLRKFNVEPMPIALPDFLGGVPADTETARNVTQIISANLSRSGYFAPINPAAFIEKVSNVDAQPQFANWRPINAQALVVGRVTRQADGRLEAEFRLWDVVEGQYLIGQRYVIVSEHWRRIAHIISTP